MYTFNDSLLGSSILLLLLMLCILILLHHRILLLLYRRIWILWLLVVSRHLRLLSILVLRILRLLILWHVPEPSIGLLICSHVWLLAHHRRLLILGRKCRLLLSHTEVGRVHWDLLTLSKGGLLEPFLWEIVGVLLFSLFWLWNFSFFHVLILLC